METYTIVRAHGLKVRALSKQDYDALLKGAKKLWDFPEYADISERDPLEKKLEKVYSVYVRRMSFLAGLGSGLSSFIYALLDCLEVENIKIHIRYVMGFQRPVLYYPYGHFLGPAKLRSLRSEDSLWQALSTTPLKLPEGFSFKTILSAEREALLDMLYLRHLLDEVRELKASKSIRSTLEGLVSLEYTVKYALWERTLGSRTTADLLEASQLTLQPLKDFLDELKAKPESDIIVHGGREILSRAWAELRRHPLDAVYIYAFNTIALTEARNVEKILLGQELRLEEEVVNRHLITL